MPRGDNKNSPARRDTRLTCPSLVDILSATLTPDGIAGGLLCLMSMGLSACASNSGNPVPFGAQVVPTNTGIQVTMKREGSSRVYVWQVHDFDGTTHILTWKDSGGSAEEVLKDLDSCMRSRCEARGADGCPSKPAAAERPHAPEIFPAMLACAASARMSGYQEILGPRATEYRVTVVTGDAARYMAAGEIPLGRNLGGHRIVVSHVEMDKKTIVADVDSCLKIAAVPGLLESCGSGTYQCETIQPMLDRFDTCLRSRSYSVEPCSAHCTAPSAKEQ